MGTASRRALAWRPSCLALCLLPVALPLLLLCLPLLCLAVAVARFRRRRRRRRRRLLLMAASKNRRCCPGELSPHEAEGHRAELLHKYLEDQMELVDARAGDAAADDAAVAVSTRRRARSEATRNSSSVESDTELLC